ncbi:S8 family serine peptidase [Kibdelosporangium aridum]|uniref:S8 family serine peptidase n=1 Tax=Kibdelosporangium aridum TaxID=2030 RepID=UPI000524569E
MRVLVHAVIFAALVSGVTVAPATAAQPPTTQEKPKTVTLITGDKVTVIRQGASWDVRIQPAARIGAREGFLRHVGPSGVTVIPASVAPLVRSGQLDRALFDVTGLVNFGYDDEHTPDIPLLVESGPSVAALGNVTRNLPAVGMTAVATPKRDAAKLFELAKHHKIWLNGKAYPTLDQSVPQVGAPGAWQQGHTGAGSAVAVLDTGYDPEHPDLAGIVKGEKDFTGEGIRDNVGHGTHVAATVAGRGKASGGKYTGVAKGADLLIGKVCMTFGCPFDAILEGMQWAADSGAKVVNMSLGGGQSDGTDPMSAAVNRISAEKGTLFVIAAGNSANSRVSAPAAADSALAVGSVNKQDVASPFSSPGPRFKDHAVKPDIAAPGEDIVAARAKGTLNDLAVDELHARLTGTSMATPHVAGAAAILAAQHPDWTGQQVKVALMNSAHPVAGATVYQQGAGRLDVARAVNQTVSTNVGSLSLGYIKWPGPGSVLSKSLTYKNSGAAPVTLALSTDSALFKVSANEVTVPAGGEASVTVSFDPAQAPHAAHGASLLAKSGSTEVRTAVGAYKEPESYDLTLKSIDRNGGVDGFGMAMVMNLDDANISFFPVLPGDTIRVPAGRYGTLAIVETPGTPPSATMVPRPEVTVRGDTVVEVDARPGVPVSMTIDRPDARKLDSVSGQGFKVGDWGGGLLAGGSALYATPTAGRHEHFVYFDSAAFEQPLVRLSVTKPEQFEPIVDWIPDSPRITDTRELSAVDVVRARPEDLAQRDVRGKLAVFTVTAGEELEFNPRLKALRDAGAAAALFYFTDGSVALTEAPAIPTLYPLDDQGPRLAKLGTADVRLAGIRTSPYHYELSFPSLGSIPANLTRQVKTKDLAEVRANYRATAATATVLPGATAVGFGGIVAIGGPSIPLPTTRTEYYSTDTVSWSNLFLIDRQYYVSSPDTIYRPGSVSTADWNKAVIGPGAARLNRTGDKLDVFLPLFTDAAQHVGPAVETDEGDTVLYANGKEIGRSGTPGFGVFTVAGPADYRLSTEATRTNPNWPLSTKVTAEWVFRSAETGTLPSITLDPKVDNDNYAKAGTYFTIPVRPGKDGVVRKVETSTDDGTTWRPAPVVKVHDHWWAIVWNPSDGFVSLRAQASYPDGKGVTQTVIRAYRVK